MSGRPHRATNDYAGADYAILDYRGALHRCNTIQELAAVRLVAPEGAPMLANKSQKPRRRKPKKARMISSGSTSELSSAVFDREWAQVTKTLRASGDNALARHRNRPTGR